MVNPIGSVFKERYEVLNVLGEGGVGTTYQATDRQTNQTVAIKILSIRHAEDWKTIELFEREARILSTLQHPNIPTYLDYFVIDTDRDRIFCIVQELAAGKSLYQWVQEGWRCNEKEVKAIAVQVLNILSYLHSINPPVIHRDIKPHNLIRREDGQIFLVDFGAVGSTYHNTMMRGSTVVGTYGYMAPEQFRGQATPSTDFYGLGATVLFLLTRRSPAELPTQKLKVDFRSRIQISDSLADWLEKSLEPSTKHRFESANEALSSLNCQTPAKYSIPIILIPVFLTATLVIFAIPKIDNYRYFLSNKLGLTSRAYAELNNEGSNIDEFIEQYLTKGGDLNAKDDSGRTLLYHSIISKDIVTVKHLLAKGADLGVADNMGMTPLHVAVSQQADHASQELVNYLLSFDEHSLLVKDKKGKTALEYIDSKAWINFFARHIRKTKIPVEQKKILLKRLVEYSLEKNWLESGLKLGTEIDSLDEFTLALIAKKSFILQNKTTLKQIIFQRKKLSKSFFESVYFNELTRLLSIDEIIQLMPSIDVVDRNNSTIINYMAENIHSDFDIETIKKIIHMGANVNSINRDLTSPLLNCLKVGVYEDRKKREELATTLINAGANPNYYTTKFWNYASNQTKGGTALHLAAQNYSRQLVQFLLQNGANINIRDNEGSTPLHKAMFNHDIEVTKILINAGISLESQDNHGLKPLQYLRVYSDGNPEIAKFYNVPFFSNQDPFRSRIIKRKRR